MTGNDSRIAALLLTLLLGNCADDSTSAVPPLATQTTDQGIASLAARPPVLRPPEPPYRLQIGDELSIRLFLTPELNEDVTIRPDGRISTQLAEAVRAAGRTPEELAAKLRAIYNKELKNPRLAVEVKTYSPTRIYVAGEVPAPGEMTTTGPALTLLQAIARAGGIRISGSASRMVIVRHGPDDRPRIIPANYEAALDPDNPAADIRLQPFDIVYVPRTGISRIYVWVNQHVQQFVPVSWGFSYNVTPIVSNKP